ncbi:MAG: c-type cytochrome [Terriglobales bacterium]
MQRGIIVALALVVLLGAGAWGWLRSARGFSAKAQPTWIEARFAALSRALALPGGENALKNPYPATPQVLTQARGLYHTQCALCHNDSGDGRTPLGQSLYPKPPDLRGLTQNKSDGAIFYSIRNGIRMSGMPAWSQDSDQEIWSLVALIRSMRKP